MNATKRRTGIWNPLYISVLSFEIVSQFANYLINPLVANYAIAMGAVMGVAGFISGLNSAASLLLRPLSGCIFSRFGRKRLLTSAAVLFTISSLVCAVFGVIATLAFSRILMGMAFVLRSTLVVALASSVVPKNCIGQGVAIIGLAGIVSNALAPGLGSWIGILLGYQVSFFVSSLLFAVSLLIAIFLKSPDQVAEDSMHEEHSVMAQNCLTSSFGDLAPDATEARCDAVPRGTSKDGPRLSSLFYVRAFPIALVAGLSSFTFGSVNALILTIGELRGIPGASVYFLTYAICAVAVRPIAGKAFDRHGLDKLFLPGSLCTVASMAVFAFSYHAVAIAIGAALLALGQGSIYPCFQAESVRGVPAEKAALAANTFYIGPDAGMAAGPLVGGVVLQVFGTFSMFVFNIGVMVLTIVLYHLLLRVKKSKTYRRRG